MFQMWMRVGTPSMSISKSGENFTAKRPVGLHAVSSLSLRRRMDRPYTHLFSAKAAAVADCRSGFCLIAFNAAFVVGQSV